MEIWVNERIVDDGHRTHSKCVLFGAIKKRMWRMNEKASDQPSDAMVWRTRVDNRVYFAHFVHILYYILQWYDYGGWFLHLQTSVVTPFCCPGSFSNCDTVRPNSNTIQRTQSERCCLAVWSGLRVCLCVYIDCQIYVTSFR